jgi:isopenicillin-N N-acyltransferase-like protein
VTVADVRPRERGIARGEQLRAFLPGAVELYLRLFETVGVSERDTRDYADRIADAIAAWDSSYAEEIAGIAAGSGLPTWQLMALNGRTEILTQARSVQPECSTIAYTPAAGSPFGVQTWDWHQELDPVWHTQSVSGTRHSFVGLTEHGILAKIGVNSAGLGLFFNILGHRDDAPGGVPVHVLAAAVLGEAATVAEAMELLRGAPINTSGAFTLIDTEMAVCAELSPLGVAVLSPVDGYLPHTNHFLDPVSAEREKPGLYEPDSQERRAMIVSRLRQDDEPAQADDLLQYLYSEPGQPRLCCVPDPGAVFGDRWTTLATVWLEPAQRSARILAGSPAQARSGQWTALLAGGTASVVAR